MKGQTLKRIAVACWFLVFSAGVARAEELRDREHSFVFEIGPAAEWPVNGGSPNYGGTIAVEKEVIEHWLELEAGVAALGTNARKELSADFLFKKPFNISSQFEFMAGLGPSIQRIVRGPDRGTTAGVEFALDFMVWPHQNVGWFVEPTWTVTPSTGEKSLGASAGLLFGF